MDLRVWKEGKDLAVEIYNISEKGKFGKDFGLKNQIRRAAVSIPSNIAEGDETTTNKQSIHYFNISKGSAAEVVTQLIIARDIGYLSYEDSDLLIEKARKIGAMLNKLIKVRSGYLAPDTRNR